MFNKLSPKELAVFSKTYCNYNGQNILHLIPVNQFDEFADRVGDENLLSRLLVTNAVDVPPPLQSYTDSMDPLSPRLVRMITTRSPAFFNTTQLTYLAATYDKFPQILESLRALEVDVNQKDDFGNTAEMVYRAKRKFNLPSLLVRAYAKVDLGSLLWQDIKDNGVHYIQTLMTFDNRKKSLMYNSEFSDVALLAVQNQTQTALHQAFWQLDVSNPHLVAESKRLWKSFFETYDSLPERFHPKAKSTLPLSGRVLKAVSSTKLSDLQETRATIISGASGFGVEFRKATSEEARVMVGGIYLIAKSSAKNCLFNAVSQQFGSDIFNARTPIQYAAFSNPLRSRAERSAFSGYQMEQRREFTDLDHSEFCQYMKQPNDAGFQSALDTTFEQQVIAIQQMLSKSYHKPLDENKETRLRRHQLKSTVVALYMFCERSYFDCSYARFQGAEGKVDDNKIFDYIDETLKGRMEGANARALYQNVKDHWHPDDSFLLSF